MKNTLIILFVFCLSYTLASAQVNLKVGIKDTLNTDVYIDGKKYDYAIFKLLDQNKIKSVDIIKGEEALKKYNAPNGVIVVTSKKSKEHSISIDDDGVKLSGAKKPLIILNGKISSKEAISKLKPDQIESIEVLKDEQALEKYNAPFGVVIIKTK